MKTTFKKASLFITALGMAAVSMQSCKDANSPGVEYMPDMYRTKALEPYSEFDFYSNGMEARRPVENTIPRGHVPYAYENTAEGYEAAGANLKNPLPYSKELVAEGKVVFDKMCIHCHGKKGEGDGSVPTNSDYPPPPAYNGAALKNLPEGKIFHTLQYGKGMMGSHASQISQEDRWKLVYYVQTLQGKDLEAIHSQAAPEAQEEEAQQADNNQPETSNEAKEASH